MSKILAVFGATGQQGSSIINSILNDTDLSQQYTFRAITRDTTSEKTKALLQKGVEIVQGNVLDRSSLEAALTGVHSVFAMTTPAFGPDSEDVENQSARTIADVAVEKGVELFIFSTLPSATKISGGKYTKVAPFDQKAKAEAYIRTLPIKSIFYCPGTFMQNFHALGFLGPQKATDGSGAYVLTRANSPQTKTPLIDAVSDTGKFIGAILAEPETYVGKTICAAQGLYTLQEIADAMSRASGKKVVYKQISEDEFVNGVPFGGDVFLECFAYHEEFGYFGEGTKKLVTWAAEQARGRLTSLDEFLKNNPIKLE